MHHLAVDYFAGFKFMYIKLSSSLLLYQFCDGNVEEINYYELLNLSFILLRASWPKG